MQLQDASFQLLGVEAVELLAHLCGLGVAVFNSQRGAHQGHYQGGCGCGDLQVAGHESDGVLQT